MSGNQPRSPKQNHSFEIRRDAPEQALIRASSKSEVLRPERDGFLCFSRCDARACTAMIGESSTEWWTTVGHPRSVVKGRDSIARKRLSEGRGCHYGPSIHAPPRGAEGAFVPLT